MRDLGRLGGPDATANFVNERGQGAGLHITNSTPNPENRAYPGPVPVGARQNVGSRNTGGMLCFVNGLNSRGWVVGHSGLEGDLTAHPSRSVQPCPRKPHGMSGGLHCAMPPPGPLRHGLANESGKVPLFAGSI